MATKNKNSFCGKSWIALPRNRLNKKSRPSVGNLKVETCWICGPIKSSRLHKESWNETKKICLYRKSKDRILRFPIPRKVQSLSVEILNRIIVLWAVTSFLLLMEECLIQGSSLSITPPTSRRVIGWGKTEDFFIGILFMAVGIIVMYELLVSKWH